MKEVNGTVRLWYELHNASNSGGLSGVPAIATSTDDGLTFSKPRLGLRAQVAMGRRVIECRPLSAHLAQSHLYVMRL